MIFEIEKSLVSLLKEKSINVNDVSFGKGLEIPNFPYITVNVESGRFTRIANEKYKVVLKIALYVFSKNLRTEADRRMGIYALIDGISGLLLDNNLGLEIEPLRILEFENITNEEMANQKIIVYRISLETSYVLDVKSYETYEDLLRIALDYSLKPGDDVADASDLITLR